MAVAVVAASTAGPDRLGGCKRRRWPHHRRLPDVFVILMILIVFVEIAGPLILVSHYYYS